MPFLEVIYKCKCMAKETSVQVASRRQDEDVLDWMLHVQSAIGVDHRNKSPLCVATNMEYAKVPVENDDGIGFVKGGTA